MAAADSGSPWVCYPKRDEPNQCEMDHDPAQARGNEAILPYSAGVISNKPQKRHKTQQTTHSKQHKWWEIAALISKLTNWYYFRLVRLSSFLA